jgi:hypothetical protein
MLTCNSQARPSWNCEQLANSSISASGTSKTSCVSLTCSLHGGADRENCSLAVLGSPIWLLVETLQSSEKQQADEAGVRSSTTARPAQVGSDLPTTKAKLPCAVWLSVSWKMLRPLLFHHPECIDQRDASGRR